MNRAAARFGRKAGICGRIRPSFSRVITSFIMRKTRLPKRHFRLCQDRLFRFSLDPRADPVKERSLVESLKDRWLPFVSRCCCVHQRGSKRGSDMGPICVLKGSFPLANALRNFAKLLKINQLIGLVRFETVVQFETVLNSIVSTTYSTETAKGVFRNATVAPYSSHETTGPPMAFPCRR